MRPLSWLARIVGGLFIIAALELFPYAFPDSINTAMPGIPDYYANSVRLRVENRLRSDSALWAEQSPCTTDSTGDRK